MDLKSKKVIKDLLEKKALAEEKYKGLYDSSRDAIMILEPPTWRFTAGNKACVELFGCKNEKEFTSGTPGDFSPEKQPNGKPSEGEAKRHIMKAMKDGTSFFEWVHKKKNGRVFYATVLLTRFKIGQKVVLQATVRDISEKKMAEEEIKKSEGKYRSLINNIPDVVWTTCEDGSTVFISPHIEQVYGFTPDEIYKHGDKLFFGRIHPDDQTIVEAAFSKMIKGNQKYNIQYRIRRKDGKWIWLHDRSIGTYKKNGKIYADGIFSDITNKKMAEEEIKKSENRFKDLVECSSDWVWEVDSGGKYTYASGKIKEVLGYAPEELIGKTPFDLMPEQEAKKNVGIFKEIVSKKERIIDLENWNLSKDGKKILFLTNGTPLLDKRGNLLGYRGIDKNITEQKKAEEEIKEREKELNSLTKNIPGMIYRAKKDWSTELVSGTEDLCGYSLEEFNSGKINWQNIIHPEDKESSYKESLKMTKKSLSLIQKYRIKTKDNKIKWVEDHKSGIFSEKGDFLGVDGIVFDITKQKKAEEELKESTEEVEGFNKFSVGRELKMIELKKEVNAMLKGLGKAPKYSIK